MDLENNTETGIQPLWLEPFDLTGDTRVPGVFTLHIPHLCVYLHSSSSSFFFKFESPTHPTPLVAQTTPEVRLYVASSQSSEFTILLY